jgi:hypothetical protein
MRRTPLRRLGLVSAAVTIATLGLAVPAQAEPDSGANTGRLTAFRAVGPQSVKIRWLGQDGWVWYGGADAEHAAVVSVPAGGNTVFVLS